MNNDAALWKEVDPSLANKYVKQGKVVMKIQPQDVPAIKESIRDTKFKNPNKHLFPDMK